MRAMDGGKANRGNEEREGHSRSGSHAPFPGTVATLFKKNVFRPSLPPSFDPAPCVRACEKREEGLSALHILRHALIYIGQKEAGGRDLSPPLSAPILYIPVSALQPRSFPPRGSRRQIFMGKR